MGIRITRQKKTPEEFEYEFRRKNDKMFVEIQKLISKGYRKGLLKEFEYNATMTYYFGLKSRAQLAEDQAFLNTMDHLHDFLCQTIQERISNERIKETGPAKESEQPMSLPTPSAPAEFPSASAPSYLEEFKMDPNADLYTKILENSPYMTLSK